MAKTITCPDCGLAIPRRSAFCPKCGYEFQNPHRTRNLVFALLIAGSLIGALMMGIALNWEPRTESGMPRSYLTLLDDTLEQMVDRPFEYEIVTTTEIGRVEATGIDLIQAWCVRIEPPLPATDNDEFMIGRIEADPEQGYIFSTRCADYQTTD